MNYAGSTEIDERSRNSPDYQQQNTFSQHHTGTYQQIWVQSWPLQKALDTHYCTAKIPVTQTRTIPTYSQRGYSAHQIPLVEGRHIESEIYKGWYGPPPVSVTQLTTDISDPSPTTTTALNIKKVHFQPADRTPLPVTGPFTLW